ncbi:17766_t:CDS:1, partial [Funneliformis geosporum]
LNIENANISKDFLLIKGDYVFVIFGDQMYVGKVIADYFEAYNYHCYTEEAITDLNDISYIFLYVYILIHHVFSDLTKEG